MKKRGKNRGAWVAIIIIVAVFFFLASVSVFFTSGSVLGNVAFIPIKGTIMVDGGTSLLGAEAASSEKIVRHIEEADEDIRIKAIVLDINSPGGSAVASDEIAQALKRTDKLTVAVIHDVGASGGYWIASATDKIVSNRMSVVGSIGVISSYLEFAELLDQYNITYQRLVAGKYKDMGTPYKELTEEEKAILQNKLDRIHGFFIDEIAANRNLPREKVAEIATGEVFLGIEAQQMGLVDVLGDRKAAEDLIKQELGLEEIGYVEYKTQVSVWDVLTKAMSGFFYYIGVGMGDSLFDPSQTLGINV